MNALLAEITAIVGPSHLLKGNDISTRRDDWMQGTPCRARAIVRPADTEQLSQVMAACHRARQPVVPHGGLTGLVGGSVASSGELAISLERMNQIDAIDPISGTLTVQAGTPLQRVQEAAAEAGMQFALDLGARGSCTVGGNIATNAGGVRVIRYGMMREQVLGLEAVLANGTQVSSMNHMLKNNAGYDLKQLFIGSEGTLGIVTRAVLKLKPQQPAMQTAMVACDTFDDLTALLQYVRQALGEQLEAFEVMWHNHYALLTEESGRHTPPLATNAAFYVLIETLGSDQEATAQRFESVIERAFDNGHISDAVIANATHQRERLWAIREDIEGLLHHLNPHFTFDVSLPIPEMERYTRTLEEQVAQHWPDGRIVVFGHLADGNLHITVTTGHPDNAALADDKLAVEALVYSPLAAMGGSVSAEHGIGLDKRAYLHLSRTSAEITLMRMLKKALDPHALLNRHKILPDEAP
ncbi:FAD-binding oxidoreductase [Marinobacter psychrophilus]|jgi:FAD/FMN-containing dehydrogenase|uniref:FAD-binding oxidoreductase n=1 Tax=Marinobacter psychrophilus TaxID=330734 RepID=UPI001B5933F5|nr:FAD-binding oxidoreductase [Marinobacter psychrophilus]MBQ0764413.1 FAD-binding oxidoreductase [Marinobacter psychrophilus]MBQ0846597.1 FAD-binding oxidoreductase [Marinobacter psychrophilus]